MNWFLIVIIVIVGSAIVNPILYFIYWELYKRKEWIENKTAWKSDERFFNYESYWEEGPDGIKKQYTKKVQVFPVRPQVKDVWNEMNAYWLWWFPVMSTFNALFYISSIIARPFETGWKWIVRKIANIKV